ncbi:MAG: PpiC-type peptidyl-prolyl cis-trans isomerase [Elusimicrobia bacterium]|nr:MAG: PpiC-type peptidyl-prolyl cis-trans isomerase [Elusimicrobiota bacterium]KAF0155407.1 MAG: PpiC-type peptidyl-prolyl cis-trans isomerase [Elusimicrobiota bacterium]
MKRIFLALCAAVLAAGGGTGPLAGTASAAQKPTVSVTVNGSKITADDVAGRLWWNNAERTIQDLIDEALILQEGRRLGVKPSPEETEARLKAIAGSHGGEKQMEQALKGIGYSRGDLRDLIERQITLRDTAIKAAGITVGDEQAKTFYDANRDSLARPESVTLRQFFAGSRPEAEEVLRLLNTGADFATLVMLKASDENLKRAGGSLGQINRGVLLPELETEVFALTPGKYTGVIPTGSGFSIFKSEDYRPRAVPEFGTVKEELKALILNQAVAQATRDLTARLRQSAKIDVKR